MNTVEADQIIREYLAEQERQKQLQLMQLRNNLNTFTLKELKKEIIKMKADKFPVTRMKWNQIIELILTYHYLFSHFLTKQGSKRSSISKKRVDDKLIDQLLENQVYNPPSLKQLATQARPIPQLPKKSDVPPPSIKLDPEIINPADLEGIPPELLRQLFPTN